MDSSKKTNYLVTPQNDLARFVRQADRDYLSRPVPVELRHSSVRLVCGRYRAGSLYVYDPGRDITFPTDSRMVRSWGQLTAKQRQAVSEFDPAQVW